jgi:flagellar biosynthesis GTPase FlhF
VLTQLQLEGPELEPLLARVRNELGASARIVHAEKIRSGGVAGFFARERFELTVEVDTEAHRAFTAAQATVAAAAAPTSGPA